MIIIGIDPGYATVGYGIVDYQGNHFRTIDYGTITTPPSMPFSGRLAAIYNELSELIRIHKPDALSVEELFFNTNLTTGLPVAHARGVILLAAEMASVPQFSYTPMQVKMAVVGYGRAEKRQVQQMTKTLLNLPGIPKPDDTADALAVAICHAHTATSIPLR